MFFKAKESYLCQLVSTMGLLIRGECKVEEFSNGKTVRSIKGSTETTANTAEENTSVQMENHTKATGKMEFAKETEALLMSQER